MSHRAAVLLLSLALSSLVHAQQPTFTAAATPNPVTLRSGGPSETVTVSTQAAGFVGASITYSFSGFPPSIQNDGPKTTIFNQVENPPYAPVTFAFSAAAGTPGGTYTGTLTGSSSDGQVQTFPFTVVVQQPDLSISAGQQQMNLCAGGPAEQNTIHLEPINGYQGSPRVEFVGVPAGVTVSPNPLPTVFLPPGQTLSFQVSATSPGSHVITARISDPQQGIDRSTTFFLFVTEREFTASVDPAAIELTSGGSQRMVTASILPNACMSGPVTVTATAPPGLIVTPQAQTLSPPSYAPSPFEIAASANMPPGNYAVTFTFSADGAPTRTVTVQVAVSQAPDFALSVSPPNLRVLTGSSGTATVMLNGINGFGGSVLVTMPSLAGVTFSPGSFTLTPGTQQAVTIAVGPNAAPGSYLLMVTGRAQDGTTRTTQFTLEIPAPDFVLRATPPAFMVAAGGEVSTEISIDALQGFQGPVTVTSSAPAGVNVTPSTFTVSPGSSGRVTIAAPRALPPGPHVVTFTGTAPGVPQPRTTTVTLNVTAAPDFVLSLAPPSVAVSPGGVTSVNVTAMPVNGFTAPVAVTVATSPYLAVTPSSFVLAPGASQLITVTAAPNAPAGAAEVVFTGTASGLTRIAELQVTISPILPVITSIDPPAVTTGVRSITIRLTGINFQPGAVVTSRTPGVTIERTDVLSSTAAVVTLSVHADATPGPYLLDLQNPVGGTTSQGATLLVYPRQSIGAPLGVTAAAIVFPRTGTIVASGEAVYARGLLATTGSGTIIGEWRLDGAPFDLFTAVVSAGMPTEVRSHVPIPPRVAGTSQLELVVTSPQLATSPAVTIVQAIDSASRLQLYEPRDQTIVRGGGRTLFRWSLVPGVSGYEVEVFETDAAQAVRFRTADAEWRPGDEDMARIGSGLRRWRVRPIFPGEVRGEPARWQRFIVLPEQLSLTIEALEFDARSGTGVLRWSGGAAGVIYRVEFLSPQAGSVVMTALTVSSEYRIPRALASGLRGSDVRVVAIAPDGSVLSTTAPRRFAGLPEIYFAQAASTPRLIAQQPADEGRVTSDRPSITAQWSEAVPADQVALVIDTTDVTAVSTITPTSITYDALVPLSAGPHTVRLSAGELSTTWSFVVGAEETPAVAAPASPDATAPRPSDSPSVPPPSTAAALRRDWALTPMASVSVRSGAEQDSTAVQISTQADVGTNAAFTKMAGDLSFRHPLQGNGRTVQESQNWLLTVAAKQRMFGEQLTLGYVVPEFLDQAQFLTLGNARGGAAAKVSTPVGRLSVFKTFESTITGVVAGTFAPVQNVLAYAYEAPTDTQKLILRAIVLDVDERPGINSAGGEGKSVGFFGRYAFSTALNVVAEAARASFNSRGADSGEQEGDAARLGVTGNVGRVGYQVNLRSTDAQYVNPANRGLTFGSVADRQGGDVSLTTMLGRTSLAVTARHLQSGRSSDATSPAAREDGVTATLTSMFARVFTISASLNVTADESDPDPVRSLPGIDRRVSGGQLTFGQTVGRITFSEGFQYSRTDSRVGPFGDAEVRGATMTAVGAISRLANLSAFVSAVRSTSTPEAGVNDQLIASLQPSIVIAASAFSVQPVMSYSRVRNARFSLDTETQSFTPMLTWTPPALREMLALQVSGGWTRTESAGQPVREPDPTYAASLSVRWPLRRGGTKQPGSVLPGGNPIEPPEHGSANPVQTADTPATPAAN